MSEKQSFGHSSDGRKKKKRNKNKKKKPRDNDGGAQGMDVQFSVDVPAPEPARNETLSASEVLHKKPHGQDEETLVVNVVDDHKHRGKVSTTETVEEVSETFDVNKLPEDVRGDLLQAMRKSNVTVVINGQEVELPPGVSLDSLSGEEIAKLLPEGQGNDGNARVIEVTETIVTEEGEEGTEGHSEEVVEDHRNFNVHYEDHHHPKPENDEKKYTIKGVEGEFYPEGVDEALCDNEKDKTIEVSKLKTSTTFSSKDVPIDDVLGSNVVIDVQTSPWKVDTDVEEIVHNNKRVRMTKIMKSRRVVITKTADGEEVETVVEEEDDDGENPEVIGEIGEFDETHNETIEIQKVLKKRRVIVTKTADGEETRTVVEEDQTPVKDPVKAQVDGLHEVDRHVEKTTIVETRRVIITKNAFGEEVETFVEDDKPEPYDFKACVEKFDDGTIAKAYSTDVETKPFEVPDLTNNSTATVSIDTSVSKQYRDFVTTEHHYIVHKDDESEELKARLEDVTHESEDKVEINFKVVEGNDHDEVIQEAVQAAVVEKEVDFDSLLGEPDEGHLKALEKQHSAAVHLSVHGEEHEHDYGDETEECTPSTAGKEIVIENEIPSQEHGETKIEELDLNNMEEQSIKNEKTKEKNKKPGNKTITLHVPGKTKPIVQQELTDEQRKMLQDIQIPKMKSVLDDWVLVNFTPEEVARFAELVRYKPGWLDESVELQQCCKLM